jgi:hypothetical protein
MRRCRRRECRRLSRPKGDCVRPETLSSPDRSGLFVPASSPATADARLQREEHDLPYGLLDGWTGSPGLAGGLRRTLDQNHRDDQRGVECGRSHQLPDLPPTRQLRRARREVVEMEHDDEYGK